MSEVELNKYLQQTVVREYDVEGKLLNIHGEHDERKLNKNVVIHTFPKNKEKKLLIPLGGERGYIMGALLYALYDLYKDKLRDKTWKGYGMKTLLEHGVFITPKWVVINKQISNKPEEPKKYLVESKSRTRGSFPVYFDYIDECEFSLTIKLTNRSIPEDIFLSMLAHIQRLGIGPKRRGKIQFTKVKKVK